MSHVGVLPHLIQQRAECEPDRMLIQEIDGAEQTYGEFHESTLRWADALSRLGVAAGHTVATMIPTTIAAYHAWLGTAWIRGLEVAINHDYRGSMLSYTLNNSAARVLIADAMFLAQIQGVADELEHVETLVLIGDHDTVLGLPWRVLSVADFLRDSQPVPLPGPEHYDPFGIIYTSGTTGASKGVICSWAELGEGMENPFPGDDPNLYTDGAYYCPWMTYHMSGKNGLEHAVGMGLRLVIRSRFSVANFWSDVNRYRCTHTLLPFIAPWLWREPERADDSDNTLRRVCMVPLIPDFLEFEKRFGVKVSTCWSSTEAGFPINTAGPPNHRTCGSVRPGYEVRVVDDHDESVPPGVVGELIVRHEQPWRVFGGYFNNPEATARAWRNGWFHTGDGFTYDADGFLYFADRLQDYIKHHGHNISAAEVEQEIVSHSAVIECVCVGVSSDLYAADVVADEDVRVFVVADPDSRVDPAELMEYLRPRMPRFMLPRYIDVVPEIPRNHLNKPARAQLRARPVDACTFDAGDRPG